MAPGINRLKTWILIAALGGLFVLIGSFWGRSGAIIALVLAVVFNFAMYWFSDRIAIATTRSKPVTEREMPDYYRIVRQLATEQNMPMPKLFVSEMMQPNAFATGRNPEHASVAVTRGILQILDERELRGVLAHELSHVANRDILISSIAGRDRHEHHVPRAVRVLLRRERRRGRRQHRRAPHGVDPRPDRRDDDPDGGHAVARVPGGRIGRVPLHGTPTLWRAR